MKKIFILFFLIILIFISELIYLKQVNLYKTYRIRRDSLRQIHLAKKSIAINQNGESIIGGKIVLHKLDDLITARYQINKNEIKLKIVILINLESDCGSCLTEYRLWNQIYSKYGATDVEMFLIGTCSDKNDLLSFAQQRNIEFTVLHDPKKITLEGLGISRTPFKVLLNRDNTIIDVEKCTADFYLYRDYLTKLERNLSSLN
ncbi:MAG: redoxin domain-containing protein [Acidobacteriota bacterium]|nr:redoxin domain-containing protein [Acidobacteriota bacterium]